MTINRKSQYTIKQVENILTRYNELVKSNLKHYFLTADRFVSSIDNGSGFPSRDIYIGVELDKSPSSLAPIHEIFSTIEKSLKKEYKIRACYYIRKPVN